MNIEDQARVIFDDIYANNGYVYIVGGSVRDHLLHIQDEHDIDVEVYGLSYQQLYDILSRYGHVLTIGKSFSVIKIDTLPHYDFALPRRENKIGHKHQDFLIDADPDMSTQEAILRRDLTMNALLYDYRQDRIIDHCGGIKDIQDHIIRCVRKETFVEDPLRVLRIAQFVARFDFQVDDETFALCCEMVQSGMLDYLSEERVYQEYCKILMSPHPSLGFEFLRRIQALPDYLNDLIKTYQRPDFHPEGNVFIHTMMVIDEAVKWRDQSEHPLWFMWSCLLHDIGKPLTTTPTGSAPAHNEAGVAVFQHVTLIKNKKERDYIRTMILYHMHLMNMSRHHSRDLSYLRLLKKIDGKISMDDLILISYCDKLGRGRVIQQQIDEFFAFIEDKKRRLGTKARPALINGEDILTFSSIEKNKIGEILDEAYDLQLQGSDKETILRSLKNKYVKG